jgi:hypothetical protein
VAFLPKDSNGLIVQFPGVAAGGAASVTGSLVLGIGTQSNNSLSGVTEYTLDSNGEFTTAFDNVSFVDGTNAGGSFIDTGSNGIFFPSPRRHTPYFGELPDCTGEDVGWFCPQSTTSFSAVITGSSGSPSNTISFQIGNYESLTSSLTNMVFGDIGGDIGSGGGFDWGLPFYFGRNVYIGFENKSSLGSGQYFAY